MVAVSTNLLKEMVKLAKNKFKELYLFFYFINLSIMQVVRIRTFWAQTITQEKSSVFIKILNYSKSFCIVFCTKMSQYSHDTYCLQEESTYLNLRVSTHFDLEVTGQFSIENHRQKISNIHIDFFELYKLSFQLLTNCGKIAILHTIYLLPKLLTTLLTQFSVILFPNPFFSYLVYNTCIDPILRLILNYESC